jgi:hypothetical protein
MRPAGLTAREPGPVKDLSIRTAHVHFHSGSSEVDSQKDVVCGRHGTSFSRRSREALSCTHPLQRRSMWHATRRLWPCPIQGFWMSTGLLSGGVTFFRRNDGNHEWPHLAHHFINRAAYLECASLLALWFGAACYAKGMGAKQASRYESAASCRTVNGEWHDASISEKSGSRNAFSCLCGIA